MAERCKQRTTLPVFNQRYTTQVQRSYAIWEMSYHIHGGLYEEIQKSKVFKKIGIEKNSRKKRSKHGKPLLRKRVKKELIEKYNKKLQPRRN